MIDAWRNASATALAACLVTRPSVAFGAFPMPETTGVLFLDLLIILGVVFLVLLLVVAFSAITRRLFPTFWNGGQSTARRAGAPEDEDRRYMNYGQEKDEASSKDEGESKTCDEERPGCEKKSEDRKILALQTLGLDESASFEDVSKRRKVFVKIYHPDRFSPDADEFPVAREKLVEINNAYDFLKKCHFEPLEREEEENVY